MQICVSIVPAPGLAEAGESLSLDNLVREDAHLLRQLKDVLETGSDICQMSGLPWVPSSEPQSAQQSHLDNKTGHAEVPLRRRAS